MPLVFPPLLSVTGKQDFDACQEDFQRRYLCEPVKDIEKRLVVFGADACLHVCTKTPPGDRRHGLPRVWTNDRAARIPWIATALMSPRAIHESHTMPGRWAYLVEGLREDCPEVERFIVIVEPARETRGARQVDFITAFPPDDRAYWNAALNKSPRIYPPGKRRR